MKTFLISALTLVSAASFVAGQTKEPRALIMTEDDDFPAFIVASSAKTLRYRETEQSTNYKDVRLSSINVYFLEPEEFTEAMELYRSRQYKAAFEKFGICAAAYKKVDEVPGNYSTLATFFQMECHRKLGDLEALEKMVETFVAGPLMRQQHLAQIEIYKVFWDAVRTKAWPRIVSIATDLEWEERKLAGDLRAQVSYCTGLALEGVDKPLKALNAYNGAFVADFAASEVITRKAGLACLRILKTHEDVVLAMKLFGTDDFEENSNGAFLIKEGIALIKLWDKSLGGGEPLPAEYKVFLKYDKKED
ncbi:hypothetical protein N9105_03195 [Akkermansiaceae bacterium]|nr:hypothetical protein [Akkermansiaceae bacterium]